jgi:hypothetical protein
MRIQARFAESTVCECVRGVRAPHTAPLAARKAFHDRTIRTLTPFTSGTIHPTGHLRGDIVRTRGTKQSVRGCAGTRAFRTPEDRSPMALGAFRRVLQRSTLAALLP